MAEKAVPVPTPTTQPFWEGTREGELRIQRCAACARHFFYPRVVCPNCGSSEIAWVRASGRATLYSYVISHHPAPGFDDDVPYVISIVTLEEGPRMLTNLVDVAPDPALLVLDMPLEVVFVPRGDQSLPLFRPVAGETR
jgi:uncharacterized OB-fold protein